MEVAVCNVCVLWTPDTEWNSNPRTDLGVGVEIIMIFESSATSHYSIKDEGQTALFKDPVRTAQ